MSRPAVVEKKIGDCCPRLPISFVNGCERRAARCGPPPGFRQGGTTTMAKFLFIYRNVGEKYYEMSPEEMQLQYQKWNAWVTEGLRLGWMLDAGHGLTKEGRVVDAKQVVSDGPFVEVKEII